METSTHYNGTVTLGFDPKKHVYTIDGKKVSGVTTVLGIIAKPALIWWAARKAGEYVELTLKPGVSLDEIQIKQLAKDATWAHKNNKDAAADMGTWVHDWIDKYVNGLNPSLPISPQLIGAVNSFKQWYDESDIEPIMTEQKLCSPTYQLAGTADFIGMYNGKLTIMDWKTGSGIYAEMLLQLGAYVIMYEEEYGKKVEQIGIVNCSVRSTFATHFSTDVQKAKDLYLQVLKLAGDLRQLEESLTNK